MESSALYIFIGPPGAGKGTLAHRCSELFGWHQLSTGNLCRQHIQKSSPLGKQIDFAIKSGTLISDQLITDMVLDWFINKAQAISAVILDGFPRTVVQANLFHKALERIARKCHISVVELDIDDATVVQRLVNRYVCINSDCQIVYTSSALNNGLQCNRCHGDLIRRSDDDEQTIRERLKVYRLHRNELVSFYEGVGIPVQYLNARVPQDALFTQFQHIVKSQ